MLFKELGLSTELLRAIDSLGYSEATPIQQQSIPAVLSGRDILAAAQTGTGKTAGFTLPMLQHMLTTQPQNPPKTRKVKALILTPTRELAAQVASSVENYGKYLSFRTATIFGGVSINPQLKKLGRGVDIVVATPGRLLDHIERGTINLSKIDFLVLDEADRMLDMGFIRDIRKIIKSLPTKRQNLLFSATFSGDIRELANSLLNDAVEIEVAARNKPADLVTQIVHPVDQRRKREMLSHLIGARNWRQVLVFARTKHGSNRLATQLSKDGLNSAAIHGNKSQAARTRALADFKAGKVRVLVATDIAARGLDIERLPHVVNFDLPNVPEDYVHRIGRTARAGQEGAAVSLVCADESGLLLDIEKLLNTQIERQVLPGYEPVEPLLSKAPKKKPNSRSGGRRSGSGRGRSGKGGQNAGKPGSRPQRSRQRNKRASAS
ncbi:MAG: DEAD/DEAH box helicase [Gammaproteobacteria bacterium]